MSLSLFLLANKYAANQSKKALAQFLSDKKTKETKAILERKKASPVLNKSSYQTARKAMLGHANPSPLSAKQVCPLKDQAKAEKAARRKERLDLVSKSIAACSKHADVAARLRKNMDEVEQMRCAKHVYLRNDPDAPDDLRAPPVGMLDISDDPEALKKLGLKPADLEPKRIGLTEFKAAVYTKDPEIWGENPKPPYVLAFRGTTPEKENWDNNFNQNFNLESAYYKQAVEIGNKLNDAKTQNQVYIVGHSLGGGLASAAQGGSGSEASTYNAAGLNPATVAKYSKLAERQQADIGKITAIRIKGEVLTSTQESDITRFASDKAIGKKVDLEPPLSQSDFDKLKKGEEVDKEEDYATYLHGMDQVILAQEKQKQADEKVLRECCTSSGG